MSRKGRPMRWWDRLFRTLVDGRVEPWEGGWLRMENNETKAVFVVKTGKAGLFTARTPAGTYTLRAGPSASGPWEDKPAATDYVIPQLELGHVRD